MWSCFLGCKALVHFGFRVQEMKHFNQGGMQKLYSTTLLLYYAMLSQGLLHQYVSVIELLHIELWVNLQMQ